MLYIIVPVIICIITTWLAIKWEDFLIVAIGFLVAILCFLLTAIIGNIVISNVDAYIDKESPQATYEICALQDDFGSYISRYYSNSYLKYNFLYNSKNGITVESIYAEDAYIHFTEDQPKVVKYAVYPTNSILKSLFLSGGEVVYDIYIPEGSITTEYDIDLK